MVACWATCLELEKTAFSECDISVPSARLYYAYKEKQITADAELQSNRKKERERK